MAFIQQLQIFVSENFTIILTLSILGLLYLVYLYFFKYHEVIMKGDY